MTFLSSENGYQSENPVGIAFVVILGLISAAIIFALGPYFMFGGNGGVLAFLEIGVLAGMLYVFVPAVQSYAVTGAIFIVGGVLGDILENYIAFGQLQYAAMTSGTFAGQLAGGLMLLFSIVALFIVAYYVKVDDI